MMADGSRGSNALGWAVLGFLAGVAVTLGVLTFLAPGHLKHRGEPTEAPSAAPPAPLAREQAPKPPPKPLSASAASSAVAAASATDQQVQEDAAAAGMTSRRQSSAEPAPN
jgi:hypothetical protein